MTIDTKISELQAQYGFELQEDYREFLLGVPTFAGEDVPYLQTSSLPVWPGISHAADGVDMDDVDEDAEEYWYHDLAVLYAVEAFASELSDNLYSWHGDLLPLGYPIGRGYGGDLFLQMADGSVHHLWPDEWDEDAVEDYATMAPADLMDELYSHWLAPSFKDFYAELCRQRGAS